jgi:hypothetical protein
VDDPERGKVLEMTGGARETLSLGRPVIDGSASFSVAAWVKVGDPSKAMVIARQGTSSQDAWRLSYQPVDEYTAQWTFARGNAGAGTETVATATVDRELAGEWHHLIGTYDQSATDALGNPTGEIELRVDLRPSSGAIQPYTAPTRIGTTIVGSGATTGSTLTGKLDELRIYAGVLSQRRACTDYPDLRDCGS